MSVSATASPENKAAPPSTPPIRVMLVDDRFVVRLGLIGSIGLEADMAVVAEVSNAQQALAVYRECQADIVLMDVRLPGMDGVEAAASLRQEFPGSRVLMLSAYDEEADICRALRAGARGYLLKTAPREELLHAIRVVHNGQKYLPAELRQRVAAAMPDFNA